MPNDVIAAQTHNFLLENAYLFAAVPDVESPFGLMSPKWHEIALDCRISLRSIAAVPRRRQTIDDVFLIADNCS